MRVLFLCLLYVSKKLTRTFWLMPRWVIYRARGRTPLGPLRYYVGAVKVLPHETWEEALDRRLQQHKGPGPRGAWWLRICSDIGIERLGDLATSYYEARAFELLAVAQE